MQDPSKELKDIEKQIIELSKTFFELQNKNNEFVPYISKVPV